MPETLAPILLRKKAEKLRKDTGDDKYRTLEELEKKPLSDSIKIALVRPLVMMFTEPIIIFMSFCEFYYPSSMTTNAHPPCSIDLAFVYCLLYLLFFAFPIAFTEIRGWNAGMTGVSFISIMLGSFLAIMIIALQEKIYKRVTKNGDFPEARLYLMMVAALYVCLPIPTPFLRPAYPSLLFRAQSLAIRTLHFRFYRRLCSRSLDRSPYIWRYLRVRHDPFIHLSKLLHHRLLLLLRRLGYRSKDLASLRGWRYGPSLCRTDVSQDGVPVCWIAPRVVLLLHLSYSVYIFLLWS